MAASYGNMAVQYIPTTSVLASTVTAFHMTHSSLLMFLIGSAIILVIPGPAVMYVVSRSIGQGRVAGLVSVMGIVVGTLFHVMAATLGLSALLISSALAFETAKYLGAAYLIYLGVRTLRRKDE